MEIDKDKYSSTLKIIIVSIGITFSTIVIELYTTFIGKAVSMLFPCQEPPTNSAPCYLKYDAYGIATLAILFVILTLTLIYKVIKEKRKS